MEHEPLIPGKLYRVCLWNGRDCNNKMIQEFVPGKLYRYKHTMWRTLYTTAEYISAQSQEVILEQGDLVMFVNYDPKAFTRTSHYCAHWFLVGDQKACWLILQDYVMTEEYDPRQFFEEAR